MRYRFIAFITLIVQFSECPPLIREEIRVASIDFFEVVLTEFPLFIWMAVLTGYRIFGILITATCLANRSGCKMPDSERL